MRHIYVCIRICRTDGVSVENSRGTHTQHAQLRPIDGHHGPGDFEKENREPRKYIIFLRRPQKLL